MPWGAIASVAGPIIGGMLNSNSASNAADIQAGATGQAVAETKRQYDTNRSDLAPYRQAGSAALTRLQQLMGIGPPSGFTQEAPDRSKILSDFLASQSSLYGVPQDQLDQGFANQWADTTYNNQKAAYDKASSDYAAANPDTDPATGSLLRNFSSADLTADPIYQNSLDFSTAEGEKAINNRAAANGGLDSGQTLKELARFNQGNASTLGNDAFNRFTTQKNNTYGELSGVAGMGEGATTAGVNAGMNSSNNLSNLYTGGGNAAGAASIAGGNALSNGFNSASNAYGQYNLLQQLTGGGARSVLNSSNTVDPTKPD